MIAKTRRIKDTPELTHELASIALPAPKFVYLPVTNARCAKGEVFVKEGDKVFLGQKIGVRHAAFFDQPIHSTVSGTVRGIEKHGYRSGKPVDCIKIENDFKDEPDPASHPRTEEEAMALTREQVVEIIKDKSLVGLGGSSFPTYVKLNVKPGTKIDVILINGIECEPYLTTDQRTMMEKPYEIIKGIQILENIFDCHDARICIKGIHRECVEKMDEVLKDFPDSGIRVDLMDNYYPQGWETAMIKKSTGRVVKHGELPPQHGVFNVNVATAEGIYEAVYMDRPVYERLMSVNGNGIVNTANLTVRVGTLLSEVIAACGGYRGDAPKRLVLGGPMMGQCVPFDDCVCSKTVTSLLVLEDRKIEELPCVRCGSCVLSCPAHLEPVSIMNAVKAMNKEAIKKLNPLECIECGLCSYSCTSGIRVTDYVKRAKIFARM